MLSLIDEALSWPNKIDIYFYHPGAGGEFFSSLCSIAHIPTRELLGFKGLHQRKNEKTGIITFTVPDYFNTLQDVYISNLGRDVYFYSNYMINTKEKIEYYKNILAHALLNFNNGNLNLDYSRNMRIKKHTFKKINIVLCTHWLHYDSNKINSQRNYGIRLFENEKYWSVINLDPITEKGKQFVIKFAKTFFPKVPENFNTSFKNKSFENIKIKFPFMDYMLNSDFNLIKDYIENRYGPNLDYDFIDKSLINYKKVRIDPYL